MIEYTLSIVAATLLLEKKLPHKLKYKARIMTISFSGLASGLDTSSWI